jgi:hypothetical protein
MGLVGILLSEEAGNLNVIIQGVQTRFAYRVAAPLDQ